MRNVVAIVLITALLVLGAQVRPHAIPGRYCGAAVGLPRRVGHGAHNDRRPRVWRGGKNDVGGHPPCSVRRGGYCTDYDNNCWELLHAEVRVDSHSRNVYGVDRGGVNVQWASGCFAKRNSLTQVCLEVMASVGGLSTTVWFPTSAGFWPWTGAFFVSSGGDNTVNAWMVTSSGITQTNHAQPAVWPWPLGQECRFLL